MITPSAPLVGHHDLGGDGVRLVLELTTTEFSDRRPMPPKRSWRVAPDQLRPSREVGVEPLDPAVVEREDVVLRRLDQEEPLQLGELLRLLGREVVRLRPVVRGVELPDVVVEGGISVITQGVLCRVTAVQPLW